MISGAIQIPGAGPGPTGYREFVIPGILAQAATFTVAAASVGIADDMSKGMVNRFRTLPMARSAVLAGRTLSDLLQTALTLLVLAVVALCVGWRIHDGLLPAIGALGLMILLSFSLSWIGALIGMSVSSPEAASSGGLIWLFPLVFVSNAFVPVQSMPGWLQSIAYWNPFSATVQACRTLFGSPGTCQLRRVAHAAPSCSVISLVTADTDGLLPAFGAKVPEYQQLSPLMGRRCPHRKPPFASHHNWAGSQSGVA